MKAHPPQASSILAELIADGRQIVLSTAMVGDRDDFEIWNRRRKDWTASLGRSLTYIYGEQSAEVFQRATESPHPAGPWRESLTREHDRVRGVVEMLDTLIVDLRDAAAIAAASRVAS